MATGVQSQMKPNQLLKKLKNAYQVCVDCGLEHGEIRTKYSTWWHETCDVCGLHKQVTEARDFYYLNKGIKELRSKI
jgi:hypothetical protein